MSQDDLNEQLNELLEKAVAAGTGQHHELGFKPIVVHEAVGVRVAGTVAWNLFDMAFKFGDVEPLSNVLHCMNKLPKFDETTVP